jgi:hypothetical protein
MHISKQHVKAFFIALLYWSQNYAISQISEMQIHMHSRVVSSLFKHWDVSQWDFTSASQLDFPVAFQEIYVDEFCFFT